MNERFLMVDAAALKSQIADLFTQYPELEDDESLRADVLEGETDLHKIIDRLVRQKLDADAMSSAIKERLANLGERKRRFDRKSDGMKALTKSLMQAADLPKIMLPDATVSVTAPRTRVNVFDLEALPQGFYAVERKAKSAEIKAALEAGEEIPGAELALGDEGLTIRTK